MNNPSQAVIITSHSHVSNPMRVFMRFHTTTFAVLEYERSGWVLKLELSLKADFGALQQPRP